MYRCVKFLFIIGLRAIPFGSDLIVRMSTGTSPTNVPGITLSRPSLQNVVETASGPSIIGYVVIIKTGRFTNHLARISSLMNNRYNLQVLTDEGKPNRKEDGSTRSTALVRGGFDLLHISLPRMVLGSIHDADLPVVLAELNRKREELKLTLFETASNNSSATSFPRSVPSAPSTNLVGSPTNRSRFKTKSVADDEEQKCIEDGEESRWVIVPFTSVCAKLPPTISRSSNYHLHPITFLFLLSETTFTGWSKAVGKAEERGMALCVSGTVAPLCAQQTLFGCCPSPPRFAFCQRH